MAYVPPGVTDSTFAPGVHQVLLTGFKQHSAPEKFGGAQAVFIATYKSINTGAEKDHIIAFKGQKGQDHYAGLNLEKLHEVAGLPAPHSGNPIDIPALLAAHGTYTPFQVEVNDKGYFNNVIPKAAAPDDDIAF